MKNALEKIEDLLHAAAKLQNDEKEFLSSYLQDISHDLVHGHAGHANAAEEIMANCLKRSLRWWRDVGYDRPNTNQFIEHIQNALEIVTNPAQVGPHHVLNLTRAIVEAIMPLPEDERGFLSSYLRDVAQELLHNYGHNADRLSFFALWNQFGSN